jgi:HPt (histidine-containing phosphotransfer) domain-containing protein
MVAELTSGQLYVLSHKLSKPMSLYVYQDQLEQLIEAISDNKFEAIKSKNFENAQLHAHSIKGSSSNIGATEVQKVGKIMDDGAKEKDINTLEENLTLLKSVLDQTTIVLRTYLDSIH